MPTKLAIIQTTVRVTVTVAASLLAKSAYENINDRIAEAMTETDELEVSEA